MKNSKIYYEDSDSSDEDFIFELPECFGCFKKSSNKAFGSLSNEERRRSEKFINRKESNEELKIEKKSKYDFNKLPIFEIVEKSEELNFSKQLSEKSLLNEFKDLRVFKKLLIEEKIDSITVEPFIVKNLLPIREGKSEILNPNRVNSNLNLSDICFCFEDTVVEKS